MPVGSEDVKLIDSSKVHGLIEEMSPDVNQLNERLFWGIQAPLWAK